MRRSEGREVFLSAVFFLCLIIISFLLLDYLSYRKGNSSLFAAFYRKFEAKEPETKQPPFLEEIKKNFPSAKIIGKRKLFQIYLPYSKDELDKIKSFCGEIKLQPKVFVSKDGDLLLILCSGKERRLEFFMKLEKKREKRKISILIDDFGDSRELAKMLSGMDRNLNPSILPFRKYSKWTAEYFHSLGFEILLHIPMQPKNGQGDPVCLKPGMNIIQISSFLNKILLQVPFVSGANNHQGSLYTSSRKDMELFMKVFSSTGLFFIDSRTSSKSVAFETALRFGVPAAKRDVFIDNVKNRRYIERMLKLLVKVARRKGRAIGICHANRETLLTLRSFLSSLPADIELVRVSELLFKP